MGWIGRARAGDEAAYRWLLQRYRARVVRLAAHVLRRPEEAEDVAQEAFLRAFRSLGAYRGDGRFYTWLYHIVVRICFDRRRLARWSAEMPLTESESPAVRCPSDSIDTQVLVGVLLDRLSPPIRAALVLRELESLEYEEIARVLEVPVGTVRSRLNAARAQFRELWRAALEEEHV
jgi:RNA polymerase sigma-70 factor (ECF subfamily)